MNNLTWDIYYASLVAMQFHPKNDILHDPVAIQQTLDQCAKIVNSMFYTRDKYITDSE